MPVNGHHRVANRQLSGNATETRIENRRKNRIGICIGNTHVNEFKLAVALSGNYLSFQFPIGRPLHQAIRVCWRAFSSKWSVDFEFEWHLTWATWHSQNCLSALPTLHNQLGTSHPPTGSPAPTGYIGVIDALDGSSA